MEIYWNLLKFTEIFRYTQIFSESKGLFFLEDWHNFGNDFNLTFRAWWDNFERNWPEIRSALFQKQIKTDKNSKIRRQIAKNRIKKKALAAMEAEPGVTADIDKEIDEEMASVFFRLWKFYYLGAAGVFKARRVNVWQIVFSKNGLVGGYESER